MENFENILQALSLMNYIAFNLFITHKFLASFKDFFKK